MLLAGRIFKESGNAMVLPGHGKFGVVLELWIGFGSWYLIVYGLAVEGWIAMESLVAFSLLLEGRKFSGVPGYGISPLGP